jgi:hypothetical protein
MDAAPGVDRGNTTNIREPADYARSHRFQTSKTEVIQRVTVEGQSRERKAERAAQIKNEVYDGKW